MWLRWMRNITIGRFIAAFTVTHQCIPSLGQPKFDIVIVEGSNIDCLRIVVGITAPKFSGTRIQGKIMRNKKNENIKERPTKCACRLTKNLTLKPSHKSTNNHTIISLPGVRVYRSGAERISRIAEAVSRFCHSIAGSYAHIERTGGDAQSRSNRSDIRARWKDASQSLKTGNKAAPKKGTHPNCFASCCSMAGSWS